MTGLTGSLEADSGGPYALTSDSDGGPVTVTVATSSSASRALAVTSGGGPLQVDHATG